MCVLGIKKLCAYHYAIFVIFDYAKIEIWAEMAVQICHKDVQICHNADKQGHSSHAFLFLFFRCFSVFRWRHSITFSEICVE